jgi:hypothetical protein
LTRQEAIQALRAQGIRHPSRQLVEDYIRVQQAEEWALEVPEPIPLQPQGQPTQQQAHSPNPTEPTERPHPSSRANLAPLLKDRGELVRDRGPRRAGRPRIEAPWFQAVATIMSDGTSLRKALAAMGITGLTPRQIRSLYRSSVLTDMRRKARQKWLRHDGLRPRDRRRYACKGGQRLGISPKLLRLL